jgi:hypothetical protein
MGIDLRNETILSLNQAAKMLPPGRRGRPVTLSCLLRWVLDGVNTPMGRVRLEAIRMGGRWITSVEALERFADQLTPNLDKTSAPTPRSVLSRRHAAERAGKQLDKIGR